MPHNRGTRHNPRWVGHVEYKGRQRWVGTHPSIEAYRSAAERCLAELRAEADGLGARRVPTVLEFAGAAIGDDGRITMIWPEDQRAHKGSGRKGSSVRRMREGLRSFLREHGDRPLDSFSRDEALSWARLHKLHEQQAVRQLFNHALDRELIERNHFSRLGASRRRRRVDRPDFQIISDEQYERLRRCARQSRADQYGLILEGAILAVGEAAMRPGEIFGLTRSDLDFREEVIHVRRQVDLDISQLTTPKDGDGRAVIMSPTLRAHLQAMPSLGEIVFPTPRGSHMRRSSWSAHWHSVRASAGMPALEFYELKHRAIQWMVDPVEDSGLGLDPATVAQMVGHDDGGYLIATVYTKLAQRRALARARRAMDSYQQRQRHLHVVGEQ